MKDKGGVAIPDKPELRFPEIVLDLSVLDDHTVESVPITLPPPVGFRAW